VWWDVASVDRLAGGQAVNGAMQRRIRSGGEDHFDLLPFITILMCVLGTLLLVTMSLAAVSVGPGVGEGWLPALDRKALAKTPVLLEWDGKILIAHWPEAKARAEFMQRLELGGKTYRLGEADAKGNSALIEIKDDTGAAWDGIVKRLEQERATHYALFAVRPSGFATFDAMANEFRRRKIDVGYEPIDQVKSVRLLRQARQGEGRP
jgi:hypothetical protein